MTLQYNGSHIRTETSVILIVTPVLCFFWSNLSCCSCYVSATKNKSMQLITPRFNFCIVTLFQQFIRYFISSIHFTNINTKDVKREHPKLTVKFCPENKNQNYCCRGVAVQVIMQNSPSPDVAVQLIQDYTVIALGKR